MTGTHVPRHRPEVPSLRPSETPQSGAQRTDWIPPLTAESPREAALLSPAVSSSRCGDPGGLTATRTSPRLR